MPKERVSIGGLPVDPLTQREALTTVDVMIRSGCGGFVVTPNVDHVVLASGNPHLREAYHRASLSLADGKPLLWMASAMGTPLPEKISGSDFLDPLMAYAAAKRRRVFFFGSTEEVSSEAARRLAARHPGLQIAGRDCSTWSPDADPDLVSSRIITSARRLGAHIVIVALGSPKQEIWMARHAADLAPAVLFGFGASLDFAAGAVSRAPRWMSKAGLEWLYRLAKEPTRLAYRYLVRDLQILPIFVSDLWRRSFNQSTAA